MSQPTEKDSFNDGFQEKGIYCRRVGQRFEPDEHQRCPYCHGSKEAVQTGEHGRFCNFDPSKDPIHFGFPQETDRETHG